MILVDFEPEPILINYEERYVPKTVTVEYEIAPPHGFEVAELKARPANPGDWVLSTNAGEWVAKIAGIDTFPHSNFPCTILRPIAPEQTWERPAGLHPQWKWLLGDGESDGTVGLCSAKPKPIFSDGFFYREAGYGRTVRVPIGILAELPRMDHLPPAGRIWRIVERGEG